MPILKIKNLKYKYEQYDKSSKYAIDDITFEVYEKDFIALVGESGSGKSTLISHLNGLYKASDGDILYKNKSIYDKNFNLTELRFKCGVVFQHPDYQLFSETVLEDVAFGAIKKGLTKEEAYEKSLEVLRILNIEHLKNETPYNLSGGEKRKVAFAGVFVMEPEILIFDEPDAGLDSVSKKYFYQLLKRLNEEFNKTIIFITHNLDDVVEYANKILVLNDGKLIAKGNPLDILSDEKIMMKCNLDMPYAIAIYKKLKKMGYNINKEKLKFYDLIEELDKLK